MVKKFVPCDFRFLPLTSKRVCIFRWSFVPGSQCYTVSVILQVQGLAIPLRIPQKARSILGQISYPGRFLVISINPSRLMRE